MQQTAKELSEATGRECLAVQADVRQPATLQEAVAKTIEKFGRIDFVICGELRHPPGSSYPVYGRGLDETHDHDEHRLS